MCIDRSVVSEEIISPDILEQLVDVYKRQVVVSYFTSGPTSETLGVLIFGMTKKRISPEINALCTLMFVFVLLLLIVINLRELRAERERERSEAR